MHNPFQAASILDLYRKDVAVPVKRDVDVLEQLGDLALAKVSIDNVMDMLGGGGDFLTDGG